ncbi:MAG: hypothetical protein HOP12_13655 [Candidatus Eisenbacteria bacterium]|uniref:Cell division protein FtsL n=1 Tax=Eiseniibacteriota bacterium TaxID=2212470 RepID=A0A849SQI5_UNCEI|nr:hypothetical protein [Candidatus Eisenbacteria bacterium]
MRRSVPSWGAVEVRVVRPELWLLGIVVIALLLVEVWQSSRMAALSLALGQHRTALQQADARLEFVRAEHERRTTRAELAPVADDLGLAPLDANHVVVLPSSYLVDDDAVRSAPGTVVAWAERAARSIVPDAMARGRRDR